MTTGKAHVVTCCCRVTSVGVAVLCAVAVLQVLVLPCSVLLPCYKCWCCRALCCCRVTSVGVAVFCAVAVLQVLALSCTLLLPCYKCWCCRVLCCCHVTSVGVAVLCAAGRRPLPPTDHRGADADPRLQRQTLPFQRLRCHRQLSGQFHITSVQVDMEQSVIMLIIIQWTVLTQGKSSYGTKSQCASFHHSCT